MKPITAALISLAGISLPGGLVRPGSGRERHLRRIRARALASQTGLPVEDIYQALGRGEGEEEILARASTVTFKG